MSQMEIPTKALASDPCQKKGIIIGISCADTSLHQKYEFTKSMSSCINANFMRQDMLIL